MKQESIEALSKQLTTVQADVTMLVDAQRPRDKDKLRERARERESGKEESVGQRPNHRRHRPRVDEVEKDVVRLAADSFALNTFACHIAHWHALLRVMTLRQVAGYNTVEWGPKTDIAKHASNIALYHFECALLQCGE